MGEMYYLGQGMNNHCNYHQPSFITISHHHSLVGHSPSIRQDLWSLERSAWRSVCARQRTTWRRGWVPADELGELQADGTISIYGPCIIIYHA